VDGWIVPRSNALAFFLNISSNLLSSYDAGYDHYEYVRMDAVVAERLTASPRIFDIYGMCGLSILSEFFPHGDMDDIAFLGEGYMEPEDLEDEDEVKPQNNLTPIEKLTIALDMAESIAELHGHPGGVIVHGDIHTGQFLYNLDKSLTILNDFNRAEWMTWDDKKKDYCRHTNGGGHGTVCIVFKLELRFRMRP
jgi:hypothetical protein